MPFTLASKFYKWNNAWVAENSNTEVMVLELTIIVQANLRVRGGGLNNQFFRNATLEQVANSSIPKKHKVWLNLKTTQNDFNQILLGYIENATDGLDWDYDGVIFSNCVVKLYSVLNDKKLSIQGKALPFSDQDQVSVDYQTTSTGNLKIAIANVDGLLENQNIYLQDNVLKYSTQFKRV